MRDLSRGTGRTRHIKASILRLVIILVGAVVVITVLKYVVGSGAVGIGRSSLVVKDAPLGLTPVETGGASLASGGVELMTESTTLSDVMGGTEVRRATATRAYGGGAYKLSVSATLPDPVNVDYQVWLVGPGGPVSMGTMRGSGTSWGLETSGSDDYSGIEEIWITLERTRDDLPEEHVMEGSF